MTTNGDLPPAPGVDPDLMALGAELREAADPAPADLAERVQSLVPESKRLIQKAPPAK
jgi:hypothetical protein